MYLIRLNFAWDGSRLRGSLLGGDLLELIEKEKVIDEDKEPLELDIDGTKFDIKLTIIEVSQKLSPQNVFLTPTNE